MRTARIREPNAGYYHILSRVVDRRMVLDANEELDLLRCRVRYFTDGLVLGDRAYVDDVFQRYRGRFGAKRHTGARPMRYGFAELFTARRLRLDLIALSTA